MTTIAYRIFPGKSEPLAAPFITAGSLVAVPKRTGRPGAVRRIAMESTEEGAVLLSNGRRQVAEAIEFDGHRSLAQLRMKAGLSQNQVTAKTGIQQPQLSRLENGRTANPQKSTLEALSVVYQVSIDEIVSVLNLTVKKAT